MEVGLEMCPIFVRKLLNNTKTGVGWRNKAWISKFVIKVSLGICGYDMELGLEMRPIFVRKLLNNTKIGIGWGIRLESRNLLYRVLQVSVIKMWRWLWKCVLYVYKKYYMILNLVLGERIRLESRNLLFRSLFVSVVKIWKWVWKCALYL